MGQTDKCILCGIELMVWERNRALCLHCREEISETYSEESYNNEN